MPTVKGALCISLGRLMSNAHCYRLPSRMLTSPPRASHPRAYAGVKRSRDGDHDFSNGANRSELDHGTLSDETPGYAKLMDLQAEVSVVLTVYGRGHSRCHLRPS